MSVGFLSHETAANLVKSKEARLVHSELMLWMKGGGKRGWIGWAEGVKASGDGSWRVPNRAGHLLLSRSGQSRLVITHDKPCGRKTTDTETGARAHTHTHTSVSTNRKILSIKNGPLFLSGRKKVFCKRQWSRGRLTDYIESPLQRLARGCKAQERGVTRHLGLVSGLHNFKVTRETPRIPGGWGNNIMKN